MSDHGGQLFMVGQRAGACASLCGCMHDLREATDPAKRLQAQHWSPDACNVMPGRPPEEAMQHFCRKAAELLPLSHPGTWRAQGQDANGGTGGGSSNGSYRWYDMSLSTPPVAPPMARAPTAASCYGSNARERPACESAASGICPSSCCPSDAFLRSAPPRVLHDDVHGGARSFDVAADLQRLP